MNRGMDIEDMVHIYTMEYSVQFSRSVVSDSFQPHGPEHTRPPCPSPTPGVYPNSCPLSRWQHPTISSSVVPFSSRLQSFPATGAFLMIGLFASVGQVLELQHQPFKWIFRLLSFRMDWVDLIAVQRTLKSLLQHHSLKASILWHSASLRHKSQIHTWIMDKPYFDYMDLCQQSDVSAF